MKKDDSIIEISKFDFQDLLIYAERYAIGRMTYAPHTVCEMINMQMKNLSENTIDVIIRDVKKQAEHDNLGSKIIDVPVWLKTLENLEETMRTLYASYYVNKMINLHLKELSLNTLDVIMRDIEELKADEWFRDKASYITIWLEILENIKKELIRRTEIGK